MRLVKHLGYTSWRNHTLYEVYSSRCWPHGGRQLSGICETDDIGWLMKGVEQGDIGITEGSTHTSYPGSPPPLGGKDYFLLDWIDCRGIQGAPMAVCA